jgi:hypothetical protein
MNRFTRLAIAWLAVGGLAALAVLHMAGTSRSAGSSPVNNPSHDAGKRTKLAADRNSAESPTRPAIINSLKQPKAQASGVQAATSEIPGSRDIPCSTTSVPAAPILSSTINVTVAGTPGGTPTVDNSSPESWAGLSVDTSGVAGNGGTVNAGGYGQDHDRGTTPQLNAVDPISGKALRSVTPRFSPGSVSGSVSFSRGVGQAQGSAAAGLLQGSGSTPLTFVIGVANDKQCRSGP